MEEVAIEEVHQPEQEHEPQEPQDLELWCLIVGMVGTAFPVVVRGLDRVWELQKTIKNEAVEIFGDFNAAQLRVYLAKKDNGEWLTPAEVKDLENGDVKPAKSLLDKGHLASMSQLTGIFRDRDTNAVHILVPAPPKTSDIHVEADITGKRKRSEHSIAGAEAIPVSAEELSQVFGVLGQKKPTEQNLIATSGLSEFWKSYGEFPSSYFVRKEEMVLWGLVMRLLSERNKQIVIRGSAGVGKSCFLMLVSFYLAFVEKRKVLVVRRLKDFSGSSAVVYLDGGNSTCIGKANLTTTKISSLPDRKEFQGALILVDGYSRKEVDHQFGLFPYQLLASSMEDEFARIEPSSDVVLPAWQFDDLLQYAESTSENWKKSTGFDQENFTLGLVRKQYFYSGGSLRDFCTHREDVKNRMDGIFGVLSKEHIVNLDLQQDDPRMSAPLNAIRRHYVLDPNDEVDYGLVSHWRIAMDSGYAYKRLGCCMDERQKLISYQFAHNLRTGFWGSVYEQCFHDAVNHSRKRSPVQMVNVVVKSDPSYSNQKYDRIEIRGPAIECAGCTENDWYERLSKTSTRTYWYHDCVDFTFADAVVICDAVLRGSNMKETIVAIISTTVSDQKTFKPKIWKKLSKALDDNTNISSSIPRVFVVVGPEASTCKRFTLVDAPAPDDFMVCCYDPLRLYRQFSNGRIA